MIRAIIIDDEIDCINSLKSDVEKYCPQVDIVATCQGGKSGIKAINMLNPDVIFLDVEMPFINGFELLEMVPEIQFEIIFTTAYDHFALKALKMSAIDYLLKPINPDSLKIAVGKVIDKSKNLTIQHQIDTLLYNLKEFETNKPKRITLPTMEGLNFVSLDNIVYCASDGAYSYVHLKDGNNILISKSLRYLEKILCDLHFFRVHKSYIVNLELIKKFSRTDGGTLLMTNGSRIKVSRTKKDEFLNLFRK